MMRACVRWIIAILILGSASPALAQTPDAGPEQKDAAPDQEKKPEPEQEEEKRERPRFVKREGEADNEQLGGEPTLTEAKEGAKDWQPAPEAQDDCDLDCIEAQLEKEEEKEKRKKRTLEVAEEAGSLTTEAEDDSGDTLAAEPSTTSLAEVEVEPGRKLPTRLGPVRIKVGKTDDWVGIGLATQVEFDYNQQFAGGGYERENSETVQFRRIRFTLSSSFIEGRIRSRFQINITPQAFELIDMWFAFTRFKFASLRIGQFKIPYDRYRAQSFAVLSFVDWASTTRMFGSERQVGLETLASGGFLNLEYALGIFTGTNARGAHGVGITEVYGEVPKNPSNLGSGDIVTEFHPEIAGRVAKNFGEINTDTNSDVTGTKHLRHSVGVGFAWDARPNATEDLAVRLSAEWLGKIEHIHINVVSYLAWYKPWQDGKPLFGPIGFLGEAGYRFTLMWELALRYSITYLTPRLRSDSASYGAFQIANATDPIAAIEQYGLNGDQITRDELAIAGTSHIIGNSLKVVLETAWESELWVQGRRNGLRINFQLQLVF